MLKKLRPSGGQKNIRYRSLFPKREHCTNRFQWKEADELYFVMDRRSIPQSEEISSHFGKNKIYSKTGVIPDPLFSASKLYWIAQNKKDVLSRTKFFLQP